VTEIRVGSIERRSHRRLYWSAAIVLAFLAASMLTLPVTLPGPLRTRLSAALSDRFDSQVTMDALRVSVFPRLRVSGERIELRHKGRTDVPPLVRIASFSAEAHLLGLLGRPFHLQQVRIDGLEINVPPGGLDLDDHDAKSDGQATRQESPPSTSEPPIGRTAPPPSASTKSPLTIDDLLSERAVLRILRSDPGKNPRVFQIHHLSMKDTGSYQPWNFNARLTNPTPPGDIDVHGAFGPWNADEPARTALKGEYTFANADLGVFDGIKGILQSKGSFGGALERIDVNGGADVPGFALADVGRAVALSTRFHSIVDATNGNTWLKPVDATLGKTIIHSSGGVVEGEGQKGRTVALDVVIDEGRIEDILRLAVKSAQPAMTGALKLKTKMLLPPGKGDAIQKLDLDGTFEIATARFSEGGVQAKINDLSRRARGKPEERPQNVVSDFKGRFVMRHGTIRFSNVSFAVPGARVDVAGTYIVRSEALDFRGTVKLAAKLSELTTGAKSAFLKIVDPIFRHKDVTVVPISIGGTADEPKFGLDVKRVF
jgi:hypothetical protein